MKKQILTVLTACGLVLGQINSELRSDAMSNLRFGLTISAESALLALCASLLFTNPLQKKIKNKLKLGKKGMLAMKISSGVLAAVSMTMATLTFVTYIKGDNHIKNEWFYFLDILPKSVRDKLDVGESTIAIRKIAIRKGVPEEAAKVIAKLGIELDDVDCLHYNFILGREQGLFERGDRFVIGTREHWVKVSRGELCTETSSAREVCTQKQARSVLAAWPE
ncbi:hypothetical protein ACFLY6_02490 [Candidatus Dependentiae bacterium]